MSEQRTEQATPQRKKKAREDGDWVRSRELLSGASMLAGLAMLGLAGGRFAASWKQCYAGMLSFAGQSRGVTWDVPRFQQGIRMTLFPAMWPAAMVMAASFCAVAAVGLAQSGGMHFNGKALKPALSRVSPLSQAKQMLSAKSLVRLAKSMVPATAVAWMGWAVVQRATVASPVMSMARLPQTFDAVFSLGVKAAAVMVGWSVIDYAVEWRAWNKRLRMSKQEMRQEVKEAMGNPQVKGKIRQMQRAMRKRKAKVDMKRASVLITNPTHYAVALEFSFDTMQAPTVLTKGRDLHALDLREEARWAGVPIVENPPLARSLYRSVEQGQAIPYELYAAIAGILAFLFREAREKAARESRFSEPLSSKRDREHPQTGARSSMYGFEGGM